MDMLGTKLHENQPFTLWPSGRSAQIKLVGHCRAPNMFQIPHNILRNDTYHQRND